MRIEQVLWDLDDDPDGNVQHIAEHGMTVDEVEDMLHAADEVFASHSSGRPIAFGYTSTGKHIAVVFEIIDENPLAVYPSQPMKRSPETGG
jgi:uncharacterized DUF497 family protein